MVDIGLNALSCSLSLFFCQPPLPSFPQLHTPCSTIAPNLAHSSQTPTFTYSLLKSDMEALRSKSLKNKRCDTIEHQSAQVTFQGGALFFLDFGVLVSFEHANLVDSTKSL